jgi:hypothetical protein
MFFIDDIEPAARRRTKSSDDRPDISPLSAEKGRPQIGHQPDMRALSTRPRYNLLVTKRLAIHIAVLVAVFTSTRAQADCLIPNADGYPTVTRYTDLSQTVFAGLTYEVRASPPGGVWWIPGDAGSVAQTARDGIENELIVVDDGIYGFAFRVPDDAMPNDLFTVRKHDGTTTVLPVAAAETASMPADLTLGSFVVHSDRTTFPTTVPDCCDTGPCPSTFLPQSTAETTVSYVVAKAELPPFDVYERPDFLIDVWFAPHSDDDTALALDDRVIKAAHPATPITEEESLSLIENEPGEWLLSAQLHDVRTGLRGNIVQAVLTIAEPEYTGEEGGCSSLSAAKTSPPTVSLALFVLAASLFSTTIRNRRRRPETKR